MSSTLSTTIVQPLAHARTRTANAISNATSTPSGAPKTDIVTPTIQPPPSPGTWQHPKLREITRRQAATRVSPRDAKVASANTVLLLLSLYFGPSLHALLTYASSSLSDLYPPPTIATNTLMLIRLYILLNMALTLRPLLPFATKPDTLTDIPLTPSQRSLLGLPPSPFPASASPNYITPPRYRRSSSSYTPSTSNATPTSARSVSANYASSPSPPPGTPSASARAQPPSPATPHSAPPRTAHLPASLPAQAPSSTKRSDGE